MRAWLTPRTAASKRERLERSRKPIKPLTPTQRKKVDRALDRVSTNIQRWIKHTHANVMPGWMPYEGIITGVDHERQELHEPFYEDAAKKVCQKTGHLVEMHDPGIKYTNRITAAVCLNSDETKLFLCRYIFSPLPHDEWGCFPLTLTQWKRKDLAVNLIRARLLWQWIPAAIHLTGDDSFKDHAPNIYGWHLEPCTYMKETPDDEGTVWTGKAILQESTHRFSIS